MVAEQSSMVWASANLAFPDILSAAQDYLFVLEQTLGPLRGAQHEISVYRVLSQVI